MKHFYQLANDIVAAIRKTYELTSETDIIWERSKWLKRMGWMLIILIIVGLVGVVLCLATEQKHTVLYYTVLAICGCLPILSSICLLFSGETVHKADKHFWKQHCKIRELEDANDQLQVGLIPEECISGDSLMKDFALQHNISQVTKNVRLDGSRGMWYVYEFDDYTLPIQVYAHSTLGDLLLRCNDIASVDCTPENYLAAMVFCARYTQKHRFVKLVCEHAKDEKLHFHLYYDMVYPHRESVKTIIAVASHANRDIKKLIEQLKERHWTSADGDWYDLFEQTIPYEQDYLHAPA